MYYAASYCKEPLAINFLCYAPASERPYEISSAPHSSKGGLRTARDCGLPVSRHAGIPHLFGLAEEIEKQRPIGAVAVRVVLEVEPPALGDLVEVGPVVARRAGSAALSQKVLSGGSSGCSRQRPWALNIQPW